MHLWMTFNNTPEALHKYLYCLDNNEKEHRDVHDMFSTEVNFSLNFNLMSKPPIDGLPIGLEYTKNHNWKLLSQYQGFIWPGGTMTSL